MNEHLLCRTLVHVRQLVRIRRPRKEPAVREYLIRVTLVIASQYL